MKLLLSLVAVVSAICLSQADDRLFPTDFKFGVATAAFQIEGGWNADGKTESIWDHIVHEHPEYIQDGQNADVSCDSYHKWRDDIAALKEIGSKTYRFSLSWPRILPNGFANEINQAGVDYYNNLINGLIEAGVEPLVTLYHWDLPVKLEDLGGWTNPLMENYFSDYARLAFTLFGDRVKYWITFNEPLSFCGGYTDKKYAPGKELGGIGNYLCAHTMLKSHAKAYHIYDDEFRSAQGGKVSAAINCDFIYPATNSTADIEAADRALQFRCGWYLHPIFHGNYPQVMIDRIAERSQMEGFPSSRLPTFTEEEQAFINGTADFIGLNSYRYKFASDSAEPALGSPSMENDMRVDLETIPGSYQSFRDILNWYKNITGGADLIVTENGLAGGDIELDDDDRIEYIQQHLLAVHDTIAEDNLNIFGYTIWTLMDNFEWTAGYTSKYGLFYVDHNTTELTRVPRKSAKWYKSVIETGNPNVVV